MELERAVEESARFLGVECLKEEQKQAATSLQGKDTFVSLPTAYRKSLIFAIVHIFCLFEYLSLYSLRFGCTKVVISDQGREFVNEINKTLFQKFEIKHRICTGIG